MGLAAVSSIMRWCPVGSPSGGWAGCPSLATMMGPKLTSGSARSPKNGPGRNRRALGRLSASMYQALSVNGEEGKQRAAA